MYIYEEESHEMGYVKVKFLGEDFEISETINEFLDYDMMLNPIRIKMFNIMSMHVKRDCNISWEDGNGIVSHIHGNADKYKQLFINGAELLIKKIIELGIYDVTVNDLLNNTTAIEDINILEKNIYSKLLQEGQEIVDQQNAGIERAYVSASNNITGSGVRIFTNSLSTLMINSMVEKNIILSQAKKADKEYEEAVKKLNLRAMNSLDILYRDVLYKEFYPAILKIFLEFDNKINSAFLVELTIHGKFDFESVENYDMKKAESMLKNISLVTDKAAFLKQAFLTCPFCFEVYEECIKQGLFDKDTFETAKYFGMREEAIQKMDEYVNNNLKNPDKIKIIISVLAWDRGIDELTIYEEVYKDTLDNIISTYEMFNSAISEKSQLDKFIRIYIDNKTSEVIKKTKEQINQSIAKIMNTIITEQQYNEFVNLKLLLPENIRMKGSSSITLGKINYEIRASLVLCIMDYIVEAKKRFDVYNKAKDLFDAEVKQKKEELIMLKHEKELLGVFAFSKRKKMDEIIDKKESELFYFKRKCEPISLWEDFENMYR